MAIPPPDIVHWSWGTWTRHQTQEQELGHLLQRIFNLSMGQGRIPQIWNTSSLIPVPKKRRPSEPNKLLGRSPCLVFLLHQSLYRLHRGSGAVSTAGNRALASTAHPAPFRPWVQIRALPCTDVCGRTAIVGCTRSGQEEECRNLIKDFVTGCIPNHLLLSTTKTGEMVMDFRRPTSIVVVHCSFLAHCSCFMHLYFLKTHMPLCVSTFELLEMWISIIASCQWRSKDSLQPLIHRWEKLMCLDASFHKALIHLC